MYIFQTWTLQFVRSVLTLRLAASNSLRGRIWWLGDIFAGKGLSYENVVRDRAEHQPQPIELDILHRLLVFLFTLHWIWGVVLAMFLLIMPRWEKWQRGTWRDPMAAGGRNCLLENSIQGRIGT
jgi:hypothetical protein